MMRVLIVDDEPQILRALRINLHARQFDVITATDGAAALEAAESRRPDVVILDLGLPDTDGVDVIRSLRSWTEVPIIVLSGRAGSSDKIIALNAGADDYVTKPFNIEELLARMGAVSRRLHPEVANDEPVRIGAHIIDLGEKAVRTDSGDLVHLTKTEWELIALLVRNPGKLVSQRQLLQEVWGPTYLNETHYLRQYMAQIRKKLEHDPTRPKHLLTEPGMGYRFVP
jgi:two-component system KDP operon response regulator KdpE